ncbi:MAG: hypothetical protein ACTSP4_14415 [Candidatus Hodarchaeales archaeon]
MIASSTTGKNQDHDLLCSICKQDCQNSDINGNDDILFSKCVKIMHDDLAVSFEYLRLNSPADQVLCKFRSFFRYTLKKDSELFWIDSVSKQRTVVTPSKLAKCFFDSLKRWLYTIPDTVSIVDLEQYIASQLESIRNNDGLDASYDELDSYPILEKTISTDCPECGKKVVITLDEGDLETIASGARMIHKAVEHESVEGIHVVNLFIDSEYKIRRKHAMKLVKAL